MAVDAIIRVSFQTSVKAHQAVNKALVGHPQNASGSGPFSRVNTAVFSCNNAADDAVDAALRRMLVALAEYQQKVDFLSVTLTRCHAGRQ